MSNRFMISVATLALVAGTGLANAQGTMNRDSGGGAGGAQTQHSQPSGGAAERGGSMGKESAHEKGTVGQAARLQQHEVRHVRRGQILRRNKGRALRPRDEQERG
ncbi:uncharacterized protein YdeI (BOF family) [Bradyrhizobium sp. GM6.1]